MTPKEFLDPDLGIIQVLDVNQEIEIYSETDEFEVLSYYISRSGRLILEIQKK